MIDLYKTNIHVIDIDSSLISISDNNENNNIIDILLLYLLKKHNSNSVKFNNRIEYINKTNNDDEEYDEDEYDENENDEDDEEEGPQVVVFTLFLD
jgi:hypothetical protein